MAYLMETARPMTMGLAYGGPREYVQVAGLGAGNTLAIPRWRPVRISRKGGTMALGQTGTGIADTGTAVAVSIGGLIISGLVSFGLMVLATYVGARWAMKRGA